MQPKTMTSKTMKPNHLSILVLALTLPFLGACGAPDKRSESPFAPAPNPNDGPPTGDLAVKPWTDRFYATGVLVASDVRIEGPDGLLEHVVARQDLQIVDVSTKATNDGLLQVLTVREEAAGEEVRAQLDNLAIVFLHSLTILERPGPVDVVVSASGDVYLNEKGGDGEKRAPTLRIVGHVAR